MLSHCIGESIMGIGRSDLALSPVSFGIQMDGLKNHFLYQQIYVYVSDYYVIIR